MLQSHGSAFSSGSPVDRLLGLALCVAAAALALGCAPKIGDGCTESTNCSTAGDRLCDITQPGGYCTIFNCEPGSCPDDSVCINFGTTLSAIENCTPSQGNSPYQRSFCMARCESPGDCRGDYTCLHLSNKPNPDGTLDNPLGAVVAEDSGSASVCVATARSTIPTYTMYPDGSASNEVCMGSPETGSSSGGSSGAGDSAGAGGDSGAAGAGG